MEMLSFTNQRKLPLILQAEKTECGLACLSMILSYFGHKVDLNTFRSRYGCSQQGLTLKAIISLAEKINLISRPLRIEISDMAKLKLPAILHWDMNHFVVLKKIKGNKVYIHDPALGEISYDLKAVGKHFTGVALELLPSSSFTEKSEQKKLKFYDLWNKSVGIYRSLFQLFLLSLLLQIFSLALPFYTQLFIDDVLVSRDFNLLKILAIGFFLLTVVKCSTELLRSYVVLHMSNKVSFQIAASIYQHLLRLPLDYFSKRHMGDIVSRFGSLNNIKNFLCSGLVEVVIDGLMVITTITLMFVYSQLLTFVALIAVLIYAIFRLSLYRTFHRRNEELMNNTALENTNFMENIRAIQGIKLFAKETDRLAGWQNYYADVINSGVKVQKLGIGVKFVHGLLIGSENIILMVIGGYLVLNNQISIGMLIAYLSFKDQFYNRMFALLDKLFEFKLLDVHLTRLADIALSKPEVYKDVVTPISMEPCLSKNKGLDISALSFKHSPDSPLIFENVNLSVEPEQSIAIIGATGCGKSSLLKVIMSLHDPYSGTISLQGVPIKNMGVLAYRKRIAGVLQDDSLLSGSILENITFFDSNPDLKRVGYVANLAAIEKDIRQMPMQYNTLVGSMGAALSGGQIQRILLARALYKQPDLLVLDEATSHLDVETEQVVNAAIKKMKIARLIVAHRPQTILMADKIFQLRVNGLFEVRHSELSIPFNAQNKDTVLI